VAPDAGAVSVYRACVLIRCSRCGAPLDVASGARRATCGYCGATTKVASTQTLAAMTPSGWTPPPTWTPPPQTGLPQLSYDRKKATSHPVSCAVVIGIVLPIVLSLVPLFATGTISLPFLGKAARWDGTETLTCAPNETLEIEGLQMPDGATTPTVAIDAAGPNCRLVLRDVRLRGETIVRAGINTRVEIERSTLDGDVIVEGNANTVVVMRDVRVRARSRVIDGGTNLQVEVRGDSKLAAGASVIEGGLNTKVRLEGPVTLESDRDVIVGELNLELRLRDSVVASRAGAAVRAGLNANLRLEGGRLEGHPALRLGRNANVEQTGTQIVGERVVE
jgi:LSD1 subclass zinc finger protein